MANTLNGIESYISDRSNIILSSFRTLECGFHNGPMVNFEQLDPESYMVKARKAKTQVVIIQTKSHWGYAYYPTKVGTPHPSLTYDIILRWVEAAHRNGMAVVAYYSGQFDMQAALQNPQWIGKNEDGSLALVERMWYSCCFNSPYRNYALRMIREIFSNYEFEGLFLDGPPIPRWWSTSPLCYCEWCQALYAEENGESFLAGIATREGYIKRVHWFQESSEHYLDEVMQIVRSYRPGVAVWYNQCNPFGSPTRTLKKASCLYSEPCSSWSGLSIGSMIIRAWDMPGPQVGMYWPNFNNYPIGYSTVPKPIDRFRAASIMMHGVRPRFITDHQNMPDGRMRTEFFTWVGSMQREVSMVEVLLKNLRPITSIGVVFSEATRDLLISEQRIPIDGPMGFDFRESIIGALELLVETQYPVDVIPDWRLDAETASTYDLIVLPECDALSESHGSVIREFVRNGGMLLASWKPGLFDEEGNRRSNFLLADILGVDFCEEVTRYSEKDGPGIYLQGNGHRLSRSIGIGEVGILGKNSSPVPSYCSFVRVEGAAKSIMNYRLPFFVPDLDKHLFQTWNPAPPGNERISRAATVFRFGKGRSLYIGVPLFRRYHPGYYWMEDWIQDIVKQLVPRPSIRIEANPAIQATFFRQDEKRLLVQLLNSSVWMSRGKCDSVRDVGIQGDQKRFPIRSARILYPKERKLSITIEREWLVKIPEVNVHSIVAINLA